MAQKDSCLCHDGAVNPFLRSNAAGLAHNGTKIACCEAHSLGIVRKFVMVATFLVYKLEETVEDALFARAGTGLYVSLLAKESVVVVHKRRHEGRDDGTVVVRSMKDVPDGVDPATRRQFWELIYSAAARGITVFVTTHYMDEAEYCDRISIMVDGKIRALGTPKQLKAEFQQPDMDHVFTYLARQATRSSD